MQNADKNMVKTYKITEVQFKEIKEHQQHWEWFDDFQHYLDEHEDDLMFYDFLSKDFTGLNNGVYIDGSISYIAYDHPLWVYVVDNNENLVPFSVSRIPQILVNTKTYNVNLTDDDISGIKAYIIKHYRAIFDYAKMELSRRLFIDYTNRCTILENMLLTEMPVLSKDETGLKTDIWVDGKRNMKHGSRIKFRPLSDSDTRTWSTCTIEDNPQIKNLPSNTFLSGRDITNIKNFVVYNKDLLLSLANSYDITKMMKDEDILKRMVTIGNHGGPIYSKEMFDEPLNTNYKKQPINVYVRCTNNNLEFIVKGDNSTNLINSIAQNSNFVKSTPYSVSYKNTKMDCDWLVNWECEMTAISQFKDIATANGFNVKIISN